MTFNHQHKLGHQVLTSIMVPMLFIFVLVGLMVSIFMVETTEQEVVSTLNSMSDQSESSMDLLFKYASDYVVQLASNDQIQRYLHEVEDRQDVRGHALYDNVYNILTSIGDSNENIFLAWVANEKANFYLDNADTVPEENYRVALRPWYESAMANHSIAFTKPYIEWITKKHVVSAIKTLEFDPGEYGFVVVDFHLDRLIDIVELLPLEDNGEVIIFNTNQVPVYSSQKGFVEASESLTFSKTLEDWVVKHRDDLRASETIKIDNDAFYIVKNTLMTPDWQMVTMVSRNEVMKPVRIFLIYLVLMLTAAYIVLFLIIRRIVTQKLQPIQVLQAYGRDVAEGRLDAPPPVQYSQRKDEMGALTRTYVTIAGVFKDKNKTLESLADQQYEAIQAQYHRILEKEKIASLGILVAGVAHEINHPLEDSIKIAYEVKSNVEGCQRALEDQSLTQNSFDHYMDIFASSGRTITDHLNRAADLIQQFKLISNHQDLQVVDTISLYDTLDQVIKSLKPLYRTVDVVIENNLDKSIIMKTYKGPLIQVFTHLISNSLEHGFKGASQGKIKVACKVEGALIRVFFEDNGQGISPDIRSMVFQPFYTTSTSSTNSGLGLYIIHNLVNQTLSGTIKLEDQGSGAKFIIALPVNIQT